MQFHNQSFFSFKRMSLILIVFPGKARGDLMSEDFEPAGGSSIVRNILLVIVGIYIVASAVFLVMAFNRIGDLESKQNARLEELTKKIDDSTSQNRASVD